MDVNLCDSLDYGNWIGNVRNNNTVNVCSLKN